MRHRGWEINLMPRSLRLRQVHLLPHPLELASTRLDRVLLKYKEVLQLSGLRSCHPQVEPKELLMKARCKMLSPHLAPLLPTHRLVRVPLGDFGEALGVRRLLRQVPHLLSKQVWPWVSAILGLLHHTLSLFRKRFQILPKLEALLSPIVTKVKTG